MVLVLSFRIFFELAFVLISVQGSRYLVAFFDTEAGTDTTWLLT